MNVSWQGTQETQEGRAPIVRPRIDAERTEGERAHALSEAELVGIVGGLAAGSSSYLSGRLVPSTPPPRWPGFSIP